MAVSNPLQKQEFIILKIEGYDAKKQTVYGVNIETGKTISIIKNHNQKKPFIRYLATETDGRHAPIGATVAVYGVTPNQGRPDTFRAEWATTISKNLVDEIIITAPTTISPVINLPNGKTQVKIRILDETPIHIDTIDDISDAAIVAVEFRTELSGVRGCILRTGKMGNDEAYIDNIRLNPDLSISEQINSHLNTPEFQNFKDVANRNIKEHSGYIEVIGYTDAINANYSDPKNDAKRANTTNFRNDSKEGGPTFSYAAIVYNKQYKNITQVIPLPALKQIKNVVGLVGSHSKVAPSSLPYFVPKEITDINPTKISVPPQYSEKKPIDIRRKINKEGQFTSVQVTIDPSRIEQIEHRLAGLSSDEPYVVNSKEGDPNVFKGFYFKKGYLDHVSAMLSDLADTPAIYTVAQSNRLFVLGRTDQEPFNSALKELAISTDGVEVEASVFSFPLAQKESVINGLGELLNLRSVIPATVVTTPKVIEQEIKHSSTAKVSFKDWHETRYGRSSKGIGDDQESSISRAANALGIDWNETKHNIDWPTLGEKTTHGKNNAIPLDSKHSVYVNLAYEHTFGYDTPGLSINFQNMNTHRGEGFTLQLTKDTYDLYEQLVKNDNYIPKVSETPEQIAAHQEKIKQNNIIKNADENAKKAANRKLAFNYSIKLPALISHKILEQKNILEAIELLGMKESFNPKHPDIKAALFDVYDVHGDYVGYQEIFEEKIVLGKDLKTGEVKLGNKLYNIGLSKKTAEGIAIGTHRVVGEINEIPHVILYSEGYANAVSNTLASGLPCIICLDVANIKNVISLMQKKYPNHTHIQVADNDIASIKKGNIGMLSALDNSYNLGISVIQPILSDIDSNEKISDTSDIHVHLGIEALAKNLQVIKESPSDDFAYHVERLLYVADSALERQLILTLKSLELEDGKMEDEDIISLTAQLLVSRNEIYEDSPTFESSVKPEMLDSVYIDQLRSKYRGVNNPIYDAVKLPPVAEKLEVVVVSEQPKTLTISEKSVKSQIENKVSPYPVTVLVADNPREPGKHVTRITSPDGSYNDAIIALLRSNEIPFHRNPDGKSFTTDVKYSNLVNSSLSSFTGAPELYTTRLKSNETNTSSIIVRGNFGDPAIRQKMEVISGKKYNIKNRGFVFESVNDYIFVKEALKHHFTSKNPIISEIEAVKFSEENTDLRAGIYKIADIFNKPSSAIAQSHVYMRIHNPRLAAFQSPLLAALYGETREVVRNMPSFGQLDANRKLDAVMHQLKREILRFMGTHPEVSAKYTQHLAGALSIIESQQTLETVKDLTVTILEDQEIEVVNKDIPVNNIVEDDNTVVDANSEELEVEILTEDRALELRIANYIEQPTDETQLVSEEIEAANESESITSEATIEVEFSPQEEILVSIIEEQTSEVIAQSNVDEQIEERLANLYDNTKTYVEAKFNEYEFEEALKEPGSSHYDITDGFRRQLFADDLSKIPESALANKFGKLEGLTAKYLFNSVKNQLINDRIEWMKEIFNEALNADPNYNAYGIASKFAQKNVYGLLNPYIDGYNKEDAEATGKRPAAYDKEMLADDLLTIDGQIDITTAAGYFKVIQAEYLRNNGFDSPEEEIDYRLGNDLAEYTRFITPYSDGEIEYYIIDDIKDAKTKTTLMIQGDEGLEPVENFRIESLSLTTYSDNSGFSEARSIAVGKERIYQAIHLDLEQGIKKSNFPAIAIDTVALVNLWVKRTDLTIDKKDIDTSEVVTLTSADEPKLIVKNSKIVTPVPEVEKIQPKVMVTGEVLPPNEAFKVLFVESVNAGLSYGDFYSEVFRNTGSLFHTNPYVIQGDIDKIAIKDALREAGYKSPKAMFDGIAAQISEQQEEPLSLELRDTGLVSEFNPSNQLSETYTKIDELLQESGVVELGLAQQIISGTALAWVSNPISSVLVHDILHEDLTSVTSKYLEETYSLDAIKLILDVNSVSSKEYNSINTLLTQQKSITTLIKMGFEGFMELDLDTKEELAKEIGVSRIVGSPRDIAHASFARINDVKELSILRNTQYSFIKAAVTIEKSGGKIPNAAIRQLNRLLNNETLYRPVIAQTIYQIEMNLIEKSTDAAYAHLEGLVTKNIDEAKSRSKNSNELILRTSFAKNQLEEGTSGRAELDFTAFKYQYFTGSNDASSLDISPAYYIKDSVDLIRTNEALSFNDLVNSGIYPANSRSYAAMFSETSIYAFSGASILTNAEDDIYTIHLENSNYIVTHLSNDDDNLPSVLSTHEDYESALSKLFTILPPAEYTFDSIAKENVIEVTLDKMGLSARHVDKITTILTTDVEESENLAVNIINKASELDLALFNTGNNVLDAQHIVESAYNYSRINAISDIVNLNGNNTASELTLLKHILKDINIEEEKTTGPLNPLDTALDVLLQDLDTEDLIDVQSAQYIPDSNGLLKVEDIEEFEGIVSALEKGFDVEQESVGELIEDEDTIFIEPPTASELSDVKRMMDDAAVSIQSNETLELLIDTKVESTLQEIEHEAMAINNEFSEDENVPSSGDVIIGRVEGNVTFGFVIESPQGLSLSPYRYQDIDLSAFPEPHLARGFTVSGKEETVPLFALTYQEIVREINSDDGAKFSPSIKDILNVISDSKAVSVSRENDAVEIIKQVAVINSMPLVDFIETFKTLSKLPEDPVLLTLDESMLINTVTGKSGLEASSEWLILQRTQLRTALANQLFSTSQNAELAYFGLQGISSNSNNQTKNSKLSDLENAFVINPVEIRAQLGGNVTLNKLISDVEGSTEIQSLLTELVLSPENTSLVEDMINLGSVNTDGTVIENGQWQDLPSIGETLPAPMTPEQVVSSTKGNKVYSRSDEVLFITSENELDFGLVLKDSYEFDSEIIVTDTEGRAIDTVKLVNTSAEIDLIHTLASAELDAYTKGQIIYIGDTLSVDSLLGERELTGNALLAIYLASNKFNNDIRKDIDLLSIPNGYEVILDNNEYALSLDDNLITIDQIGTHTTMAELRKAILVAKRSTLFKEENNNENNRIESTRSSFSDSPDDILPNDATAIDGGTKVGSVPDIESEGNSGNNRGSDETNGEIHSTTKPAIVSGELNSELHVSDRSNIAGENINLPSDGNTSGIDFTPNINFIYDDELIEDLTKPLTIAQTYEVNLAAIKLAKNISKESRNATNEEKRTLAKYRGWGGAKAIFSGSYQHSDRRTELSEWLTAEEFESARRSVLSAFYTSPHITKATWSILTRLGIKGGVGLEPSFGTGNFASTIPLELQGTSALQGRELDSLTGEIAGHIHGNLVKTAGFESTNFPSNHFDFSIGNIPFGNYTVYDKNHKDMSSNLIHDYFILKMLDKIKPGGFVPVLTSSGTMDKKSDKVRKEISKTADLIGAIRLPNSAFKDNSGTEALIDILVFQKRAPNTEPSNTEWLNVSTVDILTAYTSYQREELPVNDYFINNEEMVLGNLVAKSSQYGYEVGVLSDEEMKFKKAPDIVPLLNAAIERFPKNIHFDYVPEPTSYITKKMNVELTTEDVRTGKLGGYVINSLGNVAQIQLEVEFNSDTLETDEKLVSVELDLPKTKKDRLAALISLKEATLDHLGLMVAQDSSDKEITHSMNAISNQYDGVVKKYKELNSRANKSIFREDPDAGVLLSLEHYDRQNKTATKADLFSERTVFPNKVFENIEDAQEATLISLAEYGRIIPEYVEEITGKSWNDITAELSGSIFENPETGGWDSENAYLSGNVRDKLDAAEAAAAIDEKYQLNVDYLKAVIPETIPYFEIRAKLGSDWLPATDVQDFIKFIFTGENEVCSPSERAEYKAIKVNAQWKTDISKSVVSRYSGNTQTAFGTDDWDAGRLIDAALNYSSVKVTYPDGDGNRVTDIDATAEAQAKSELIKESFKSWIWTSESRAIRLEGLYNRLRNSFVEPKFDGSQIQFNGLSPYLSGQEFSPRENQRNAVMRYLTTGKCLFIHDVGVGKSFTLLASIMKGHEVGRHTKPVLAVPKSVFPQMQSLALAHYPNAKILMLDAVKTTDPKEKAVIINKIAMNNWDIIILPHTVLPKLDVPLDFKLGLIEEELSQIEQSLLMLDGEGYGATSSLTSAQSRLEKERSKLNKALDENETYDALNIAELGIDAVFVDEADEFVNLKKITRLGAIKGVGSAQSNRATALHRITEYLHREVKDAGVVLATGTDIRNNMADLYTLMRFTDPTLLESSGVMMFDDFVGSFGDIQTQFEIAPEGSGYIEVTRLNKFINIPELLMMYRQVADVVTAEQAGVVRPQIEEIHVKGEQCEYLEAYMGVLAHRAERSRSGSPVFENDNLLAITGGGRKSSLSMNLIDKDIPYNANSKVGQCIENVAQVYKDNLAMSPTQIIFSDMGVPNKDGRFDLYNQIKSNLVDKGIPDQKIVFARDFNTDIRKQDLQDRMNSGDIAVCIGSTENMGVGKNVQKRLAAIHDLSIPWRYRDMVQRLGRIERFGNLFKNAKRFIYITEDSFDLFILQKVMQKAEITLQAKLSPRDSVREFVDDVEPKHSDIMALGTSNPVIQQVLEVESKIIKLEIAEKSFHKSLINLRDNKKETARILDYANNRVVELRSLIAVVSGNPVIFGEKKMETDADVVSVSKALNKAINTSLKAKNTERSFKVGSIGDADIIFDAKFNGRFVASIKTKDSLQEITQGAYIKTLVDEMTRMVGPDLERRLLHAHETIEHYEIKIDNLNSQNISPVFPQAKELQDTRVLYNELEIQKATLLNEVVEFTNPIEKFNSMIFDLNGTNVIEMKPNDNKKDSWEPDIELLIEPVA
jgi:N12 class adenine-specific DNA methylase